ncbi:hypothetical protein CFPU101_47300 [Chroococcus sp. FPU101]|nr:hypothetical protein CFPU101_47300 [Chroococcus sp. FPU101]
MKLELLSTEVIGVGKFIHSVSPLDLLWQRLIAITVLLKHFCQCTLYSILKELPKSVIQL